MHAELPLAINCGDHEPWRSPQDILWEADHSADRDASPEGRGWSRVGGQGVVADEDLPLAPASHAGLLHCQCRGVEGYRFLLPEGHYRVTLVVAWTFETLAAKDQAFAVSLGGEQLTTIQPSAVAGGFCRAGLVVLDGLAPKDGELRLDFGDGGSVCGIQVTISDSTVPSVTTKALDAHAVPAVPQRPGDATAVRMLFVGHGGLTHWALPQSVARMLALAQHRTQLDIDMICHGGKDSRFFAESPEVRAKMAAGPWDYIVLQGSSWAPIERPAVFDEWMPRLISMVREHNAKPILFAYAAGGRFTAAQQRILSDRYDAMGEIHRVPVVPCAKALINAMEALPGQNYHDPDQHHLGMFGAYLYAATWFKRLTGRSASELTEASILDGHLTLPHKLAGRLAGIADLACGIKPAILR